MLYAQYSPFLLDSHNKKSKLIVFLTNNSELSAEDIIDISY